MIKNTFEYEKFAGRIEKLKETKSIKPNIIVKGIRYIQTFIDPVNGIIERHIILRGLHSALKRSISGIKEKKFVNVVTTSKSRNTL